MSRILLVAHQPLASAFWAAAQHVYPDCGRELSYLDIAPGDSIESVADRVRDAVAQAQASGGALVLVDTVGATPFNGAQQGMEGLLGRLVTGLNLPMLWRCLCYASESLDDLAHRAEEGGRRGVSAWPGQQ